MGNNIASTKQFNHMTQIFAICTFALLVKYTGVVFYAANSEDRPPEDAKLIGEKKPPEDIKRRQRTLANDMENIPLHLIVFWAAYLLQSYTLSQSGSEGAVKCLDVLFIFYTVGRYGHTACYLLGLQPWRSVFFLFALLSVFAAGGHLIYSSFKIN